MADVQEEKPTHGEAMKILVADKVAREGIDLLRAQLPEAQIDERLGLKPEQLKAIIGSYAALVSTIVGLILHIVNTPNATTPPSPK